MEKIILNGRELTLEEFQVERERIEKQKGMKLVEVSPGNYKIRLLG